MNPRNYAEGVIANVIYHEGWQPESPKDKPPALLMENVRRMVKEGRKTYESCFAMGVPPDECARRIRLALSAANKGEQ